MSDRFYFRQLLSGRDFAQNDPVARQMVNFVYVIGDRQTGVETAGCGRNGTRTRAACIAAARVPGLSAAG